MRVLTASLLLLLLACGRATDVRAPLPGDSAWVATWAPSQQLTEPRNMPPAPGLQASTLRQVLRVTLGGSRLRIRISNLFGESALALSSVRIARPGRAGSIVPATDQEVSFEGRSSVTIPSGGSAVSDPVTFEVAPLSDLAVTIEVVSVSDQVTGHPGSRATSYLVSGRHGSAPVLAGAVAVEHWYLLSAVDVMRGDGAAVVAVLGNSITDGRGSGTDRNTRWTDYLASRLQSNRITSTVGVVNAGLGGNALLRGGLGPPALERFERDVLDQPGVRWMIVLIGVNDIGNSRGPTVSTIASELIAGYVQIVQRARARGVPVYGATILPFGGSQYDSPEHEASRRRVNEWIRTAGAFDAVIDFDATMRDPQNQARLRSDVDSGDHLHPNEAGYRVMAETVDLALFTR